MNFDISIHGDILEKEFTEFIRSNIPVYEKIWDIYIGNDGKNRLIEVPELTPEQRKQREFFSQYYYTAFESFVCIHLALVDICNYRVNSESKIRSLLHLFNYFVLFWAHVGRFNDNIKEIQKILNEKYRKIKIDLTTNLDSFYQERNQILHDRKIPYILVTNEIMIPKIDDKGFPGTWNELQSWYGTDVAQYNVLTEFINDSYMKLLSEYNSILSKIFDEIKEICEEKDLKIKPSESADYSNNFDSSSAEDVYKVSYKK